MKQAEKDQKVSLNRQKKQYTPFNCESIYI